jgi:hypothetical protein
MNLSLCDWKHGKRWVYSITYDEALEELHRFAVPYHEQLGIPGHVEAVAGHIGRVRQIGQSSYNGFHHMGPDGLRDLLARGWGVGNHSWSHEVIGPDDVQRELGDAKKLLEDAIGAPVVLYCAPGSNVNMADHVLEAARRLGYLGAMSITDALNRPGDELFWLNRTPLHEQYYEPFFSAYDPFRNIRYAQEEGGWIIDYCHCPLEKAVHPNKDCSEAQLRRRFETVLSEGGDDVWCANPDEAINYHVTRRHTRVETLSAGPYEHRWRLRMADLPEAVTCTELTLEAVTEAAWCAMPRVELELDGNRQIIIPQLIRPRTLRFTVEAADGMEIIIGRGDPARRLRT